MRKFVLLAFVLLLLGLIASSLPAYAVPLPLPEGTPVYLPGILSTNLTPIPTDPPAPPPTITVEPTTTPLPTALPTIIPPTFTPTMTPPNTPTATPTETVTPTPTATPNPADWLVVTSSYGELIDTSYVVYMDMLNTADFAYCYPSLTAKLQRADGSWIVVSGLLLLPRIDPGQHAPARFWNTLPPGTQIVSHALLSVDATPCAQYEESGNYFRNLTVTAAFKRDVPYTGTQYYGDVRNDNDVTLNGGAYVAVTIYQPNGYIRAADAQVLPVPIPSGGTVTFSMQTLGNFLSLPAKIQASGHGFPTR